MAFNPNKCLKFTAIEDDCSISLMPSMIDDSHYQFSKDGINWSNNSIYLSVGESAYCKGTQFPSAVGGASNNTFSISNKVDISGSIMSLVDDGAGEQKIFSPNGTFAMLFAYAPIQNINKDLLPATTLSEGCYYGLFYGCSELTSIPEGLLPATELANSCYATLFSGCSGLTSIPDDLLPATTLSNMCYGGMFMMCTGLTSVPISLFKADTFDINCYMYMFNGCSNINSIEVPWTAWPTDAEGNPTTALWLGGVAINGTFKCPAALPQTFDDSHIPESWERITPTPTPTKIYFQPEKL